MPRSAPYEKSKFSHSGGSMVARLKLKEIDGRAPQGVNCRNSAPTDVLPFGKMWICSWEAYKPPNSSEYILIEYAIHLYCENTELFAAKGLLRSMEQRSQRCGRISSKV